MDPFTLTCSSIPGSPRVVEFRGEQALGECFDYEIIFLLESESSAQLEPKDVLGQSAQLKIGVDANATTVSGRVAEIELLDEAKDSVFRLRVVPSLWFLRHSAHNRVLVKQSWPDIMKKVLESGGIAADSYDVRLSGDYPERDHVCQYQESDLAFIERWMQREGIYYFFDHAEEGSKLVICDAPSAHPTRNGNAIRYHSGGHADVTSDEHFEQLRAVVTVLPEKIAEGDYNCLTPDTPVTGEDAVATELKTSIRYWGENEAKGAGAARLAKLRAEEAKARRERLFAEGLALGLHTGFVFSVSSHPTSELNRDYLAVRTVERGQITAQRARVESFWGEDDSAVLGERIHRVSVEAIASDIQYRPPRAPWPHAGGLELARVDGAVDEDYAQLDEHGRYLVELMMDENDSPAGKASMRVRHVQPHGGEPEGWHLPLRKGTEVLLGFVGGDPDRPVIVGAIPNLLTPAMVTESNATKNVFQSGGRTRIEIEDQAGQQYVDISTPPLNTYLHMGAHAGLGDHNVAISTDGDTLIHTTGKRDIKVQGVQNEDVKGTLTETYHANQTTHVAGAFGETIDSGATQTIHSGFKQTISGSSKVTIDGGETRSVSGGLTETIVGGRTQTINGASTEVITGSQTQTNCAGTSITTPAKYTIKADGGITLKTDGVMNMMALGSWTMNAAGGQTNVDDFQVWIAGYEVRAFALTFQPNVVAVAAFVLAVGIHGLRRDNVIGLKFELSGLAIANAGTKFAAGGKLEKLFGGAKLARGFRMFL